MVKNRVIHGRNITKKIIINDGGLIISVMDVPTQNTEAEQEDRITDKNIDLQGPSNSSRDCSS